MCVFIFIDVIIIFFSGDNISDQKSDNYPSYRKPGSDSGSHQQIMEPIHHVPGTSKGFLTI